VKGGMSSSSSTERKKTNLEKLVSISEGKNRKEERSKNDEDSLKNIKKKEDKDLQRRRKKTTKISEYFEYMPSSIAYLEETVKENFALSGTAMAARPTSPPSRPSSRTSSPSTAGQEQLPPSETRSLSPYSMFTNGSTLCAQYLQRTADYCKREDDRVSRLTNVCGPITASRLANREKVWEISGYQGDPTENEHHST
jgi:hypothetical protein